MGEEIQRRDLGDGLNRTAMVDGSKVGGYTVSYLASGGMSVVYKGEKLGRTVCLKEVQASNTREVPSLVSEKSLLERLNHPGVLGYESFFNENGYYYLVTEFVPGNPLSDLLDPENPPAAESVMDWGIQLCEIFAYLHQQSPPVIYRDLKSENILLTDNTVKLIDFGIARIHKGSRQKDTELMGSPVTASPEHYGGAETDARSDIYTLGATLYELLTGGRRKQVGAFKFAPVRELRSDVSPEFEAALSKAVEFQPDARYQTAEEFRDALLVAAGRPVPKSSTATKSAPATPPKAVATTGPEKPSLLKRLFPVLLVLLLVCGAGFGAAAHFGLLGDTIPLPALGGPPPPKNSHEASLEGNLFAAGDIDGKAVVLMGEDLGLFEVTGWKEEAAGKRAGTLAKRLNTLYHSPCLECNKSALEPEDIKVGRYLETKDIVIFYCHMHGEDVIHWGPDVLVTVTAEQAEVLGTAPRFVATYWRDLIRDIVNLSRGFTIEGSVLGPELTNALMKARSELKPEDSDVANLRRILRETSGQEALRLRKVFLEVPDRKPVADSFKGVEGYEPLRI